MKKQYSASIIFDCNQKHPDAPGVKGLVFKDTYTIDPDAFYGLESIHDYIAEDLSLVAGGGYKTDTIENSTITITEVGAL